MDIDPEKDLGEYVELQRGYAGYKYPEEICRWFSIAIQKDVIAVRSSMTRKTNNNPKRLIFDKNDQKKTFTTDASFHVIGKRSV